ncbi:MAG: Uma2 family endonuclease [Isosphaeraceae bacterium]
MTTATTPTASEALAPLEIPGPVARVPSLEELHRLTEVPDRPVVYRGVAWGFYRQMVDSIPQGSGLHVDYDGKDLQVMTKGLDHEDFRWLLGLFIAVVTEELRIPYKGLGETTWARPDVARGLESDQCYLFAPEKLAQFAAARRRGSRDIADYPNPDLAVEVDISHPEVDRPAIYAALRVAEVWRFDHGRVFIERLTPQGTYEAVESSGFLPVQAEDVRRWLVDEDASDDSAWTRRLREEIRRRHPEGGE